MRPAIFLDRDGVIIENRPGYVRRWEDVSLIPGSLEALARLYASPYQVVIVTNQAGIGHGLVPPAAAEEINRRLLDQIHAAGGRVDGLYVCPHTPTDACTCRKPQPGMLLQAAQDLDIDLARSLMIGDALSDIQAAHAAGVQAAALVLTGRGSEQSQALPAAGLGTVPVFRDLQEALEALVPGI